MFDTSVKLILTVLFLAVITMFYGAWQSTHISHKCLEAGYSESKCPTPFSCYCITRQNQTDIVVDSDLVH